MTGGGGSGMGVCATGQFHMVRVTRRVQIYVKRTLRRCCHVEPNDFCRDAAPIELYRDTTPIDLQRDAAPIDLCRDAAPIDLYRDVAPIDLHNDTVTYHTTHPV